MDSVGLGLYLCRRFFLLICEADIFRSLVSPDRLSSSGSSGREEKSHVPVGSRGTEPSPKTRLQLPAGSGPGAGVPSHSNRRQQGRSRGWSTVLEPPDRGRGSAPTLAGGSEGQRARDRSQAGGGRTLRRRRVCPGPHVRGSPGSSFGRGSPCAGERPPTPRPRFRSPEMFSLWRRAAGGGPVGRRGPRAGSSGSGAGSRHGAPGPPRPHSSPRPSPSAPPAS